MSISFETPYCYKKFSRNTILRASLKNLAFDHLILNPSPKGEGQKEFLEMPLN